MNVASSRPAVSRPRSLEIAEDGLLAGVLGGLTVALFFLVVDVIEGRPLFTPSLLGSVVFLGESAESVHGVSIPMMFAYTGLHMALFVIAGMIAAFIFAQFESNPPLAIALILLFVCFEAGFFVFTVALAPGVLGVLGAWLVGVANLLSAATMVAYLWWSHPEAVRSLEHVWDD